MNRLLLTISLFCLSTAVTLAAPTKIVLIAGPITGHDKNTHEYEKSVTLLKHLLDTSPNLKNIQTEAHFKGWPTDDSTLDTADTIVFVTDGGDHNEKDHPLYVGDRFKKLEKQMKRGCGLVQFHWSTFHPSRVHDQITEWVGGYFDYETGSGPNKWYSAIQTWTGPTSLGSPDHPISRGVKPFTVQEEFYYRIKFRDADPRLKPILLTRPPNEKSDHTVGWAVERADGGRGFGYTGGHFYKNWWMPDYRKLILNAIVWSAGAEIPKGGVESIMEKPIRALILTGYHHPGHDWRKLTASLILALEQDPRMEVDVTEDIEDLAGAKINDYDLLVMNYNNWDKPGLSDAAKANFQRYLKGGGGLALIHFANGAFNYTLPNKASEWTEYRTKIVRRAWMHDGPSGHDAFGPFKVSPTPFKHPITAGLAPFDTTDELYFRQGGDLPITPLVIARSKVTGQDEPLAWAYNYGKGRVFQSLLGHDEKSVRMAGALIRRGAVWASNRNQTRFDPPVGLMENALFRRGSPWTIDESVKRKAALEGAGEVLMEGRFGKALNGRVGGAVAPGRADYSKPPLTIECWARLNSKTGFNILVANENKSSPTHWELFTMAGSGALAAYLPGNSPDHARTNIDICDDKWHYLVMVYTAGRVKLYVDAKLAADQEMKFVGGARQPGDIGFATLPARDLGCSGLIDDVRISQSALEISSIPSAPLAVEDATLGLWRFDALEGARLRDIGRLSNPAKTAFPESATVAPKLVVGRLPDVNLRTSVDWANVGNDKGGMRYSKLSQINRNNVSKLKIAWTFKSGDASPGSTIECTPIVVDGIMYITTTRLKVVALDAASGRTIWQYDPKTGGVNRGLAYWSDNKPRGERRILMGTPDGRLISLDAKTGVPDPKFGKAGIRDLRADVGRDITGMGYGVTSAVAIFENMVYVGFVNTEGQPGAPGDIRAFDVLSGREVWRFQTVPSPGQFGNETWEGDSWKERSGTNPWSGFTLDAKRGILFCGTGSAASDFYGADRKGANLFANCTLALDARTGKRLWHFQTVHHDLWDHDTPCPPVVVRVKRDGKMVDAVAQPTKTGYCYLFDLVTGKPLFDVREVPAPSSDIPGERAFPTQPEPVKPPRFSPHLFDLSQVTNISAASRESVLKQLEKLRYGASYLPPNVQGTVVLPGFHGGATWSGASFDPTTGLLYVNSNNVPYISILRPNANGGFDFGGYTYFNDHLGYPANKPPWGSLTAINLATGEFAWQIPFGEFEELTKQGVPVTGTENFGGTIVTAGGLVFVGATKDEKFHAYDKATGKLLWEVRLPAGGYSTPATYQVNGKQYVVIAAGGGGKLRTKSGDTFVVFALEDK